jgi:hypothetical protein
MTMHIIHQQSYSGGIHQVQYFDITDVRPRSSAIAIKGRRNATPRQDSADWMMYDLATWRMYNRITSYRKKFNRSDSLDDHGYQGSETKPSQQAAYTTASTAVYDPPSREYTQDEGIFQLDL